GHLVTMADTLESCAALAATLSRPELAVQLAGAVAALREAIGAPRPPLRRDFLDRWLPALQLEVEEDVFARSWAAGQAMTTQQAIALALTVPQSAALLSGREQEGPPEVAGLTSREGE